MSRHIGCLCLTYEALAKAVGIPSGHTITAIVPQTGDDVANQSVRLIVEGPSMPRHTEGGGVMNISMRDFEV
jgi:hypothetical protein